MQKSYAPLVLRSGLAFVFLWFGFSQLYDQSMWTGLIPNALTTIATAKTWVIANGVFEIIAGSLLAWGIGVRIVVPLLTLHLATIVWELGLTPVGIRDIGLVCALISVWLQGSDEYCVSVK